MEERIKELEARIERLEESLKFLVKGLIDACDECEKTIDEMFGDE